MASNFAVPIKAITKVFKEKTGHNVILAFGSTGKHYAQITHGAPFDIFLAADKERPRLLERSGLIVDNSRFTYARGSLILWAPERSFDSLDAAIRNISSNDFVAIANPKLSPYGLAAKQVLQRMGLWLPLQAKIVRGENIAQAFQFVSTGNANVGFIAGSQLTENLLGQANTFWSLPPSLYSPIDQQAVLLKTSKVRALNVSKEFLAFLKSTEGKEIIQKHGYRFP
ncbi:MAG: molybdate ABC transporter substrate-binding protein [Porticoccaceae bacterium]|nr:molybdate ABC transporter substrate-binding protein [Porticoccaceae bacterium]